MTDPRTVDPVPAPPVPAPPAARTRGWVKLLLAVSLALNLGVLGLTAGAFLRNGGPPGRADRDLGLGPLAEALDRSDRRALRRAFLDRFPDMKAGRAEMRADFDALLTALRADPFDPDALDAALDSVATRNVDRLDKARGIIADYLKEMDPADRAAFATRLEKGLRRGARHDHE